MPEQVPSFSDAAITRIAKDLYGIEGDISPLVSFDDQNARIRTPRASYVLKIANKKWPPGFLQTQTDVLAYLKANAPGLAFPSVIPTLKGDAISIVDGFAVRLLTYLEGELLTNVPRSPELYRDIGRFLGQFSKVMQDYPLAAVDGMDEFWKLDNVMMCRVYLPDIIDEDTRDRIERLYADYEENILPRLPGLRKAVIHGDANEQNFLVAADNPMKISGLIDFGDMHFGSQVNDLAIALAYGLLEEQDIAMASANIIEGYEREFELQEKEREILFSLAGMRLVTSITMSSHGARLYPDNEYILISQQPAQALLKKLEEQKYILYF